MEKNNYVQVGTPPTCGNMTGTIWTNDNVYTNPYSDWEWKTVPYTPATERRCDGWELKGWECPKCGKVWAPCVDECRDCNIKITWTTATWTTATGTTVTC